ncbi:MAG: threonine/serine exporter family protein [Clostridiales bacterium]|nr:threonine/serine exporter family protein [Clostridiales bacterium]
MNEKQYLIKCLLDLGESLLLVGAEINRVEDSLTRVAKNYGAFKVDVFVLTSVINITVTFNDNSLETQTRRLNLQAVTDFKKIEELNALCRYCANMSICEFDENLHKLTDNSPKKIKQYIGSFLTAGGFALFFGGSIYDGILAGIFALLICFLQLHYSKICPNKVFFYLTSSLVIGLCIFLCTLLLPRFNSDMIIIGDIMLLIPGLAITNAVRDIIIGDTVSGLIKFSESLLWAISLAGGFMLAMSLWGGVFA